jgi:hypothetical protein
MTWFLAENGGQTAGKLNQDKDWRKLTLNFTATFIEVRTVDRTYITSIPKSTGSADMCTNVPLTVVNA